MPDADPCAGFWQYVAGIDWGAALLAGAAAVAVGAAVLIAALATAQRTGTRLWDAPPRLAAALGRVLRAGRRPAEPATRWLCGSCLSWNPPGSARCARGCGPRTEREQPVPQRDDELGGQRGGRGFLR